MNDCISAPPVKGDIPRVGVVLLNWNGGEYTILCIASLKASRIPISNILVVDNASKDDSPMRIAEAFPDVELIRAGQNLGFTGGNNLGIGRLLKTGVEYIWILNNDTRVHPDCLSYLLSGMMNDPKIAAATGKILYENPSNVIWYGGARIMRYAQRAVHVGAGEIDHGQYDTPCDTPFLSGCCMLIRREAIEEVGHFNRNFFIYCEDFDWCLRALKLGKRLRYIPEAVIWHRVSASVRKNTLTESGGTASPLQHYLGTRNHLFVLRLHSGSRLRLILALILLMGKILYLTAGLIILRRWDKLCNLWRGLFDGLTRKLLADATVIEKAGDCGCKAS